MVEQHFVAHVCNSRRPRAVAKHRDHRVARNEMDEREGQRRNPQRDRDQRDEAADQVVNHLRPLLRSGASDPPASERKLPLGYGVNPRTSRFITTTLSIHQSETYGRLSAAIFCTCAYILRRAAGSSVISPCSSRRSIAGFE